MLIINADYDTMNDEYKNSIINKKIKIQMNRDLC